ncbi:hypothetical protein DER46DRAFT_624548 [Fusarium sp. MPI-SDFR-AT-0072]|nr:hypothetical protein DER46DRAFT_624548 [Fusarium sp. MPI-SDFR-AT-0072]
MVRYAKDQPAGFTNSTERVAIVGAGGTVGSHIANALLRTGKHKITALTRKGSTNDLPDGIRIASIDYNDESTLVAALQSQQFLIITMAPNAPKDTHSKLVQAAAKAGVPYIMPNGYADDIEQVTFGEDTLLGPIAKANRDEIERLGMNWITVCCGFWFDYSLAGGENRFGFDFDKKILTLYDDGNVKNSTSTLAQVGRAVAKVLSLKELPDDENDKSLTISSFLNKAVYLNSFVVSQRDLFESVKRVTGTSDSDWTVTHKSSKKRYEEGMAQVKRGDMSGFSKLLYARAFFPEDPSNLSAKAQNELLGLPEEELDEATKDGIALVEVLKGRDLDLSIVTEGERITMSSNIKTNGVAIIGAGLGGTALALAFHRRSIPCRIFEARGTDSDVLSSGVTLTPNGCRVLDELGILSRLQEQSYICKYTITKDADDKTSHLHFLEKIPIFYDMKFEKFISDTPDGVVFQVGDRTERAAMVIGSDGIHLTLRRHITDLSPVYTNLLCVYGHIPMDSVEWPDQDFAAGCTILEKPGSLFMVPEVADGSDLMIGTQFAYPEADRKGWEALAADPASLSALLRKDYDQWHDTAKHAIDELCKHPESLLCWPFYAMPKLHSWSSSSGNVVMIGDAAHAMPASSGQGVNQTLEDAFSLANILSYEWNDEAWPSVLITWQSWRQNKIDRIHEMMRGTNMMRSSELERSKLLDTENKDQSTKDNMQRLSLEKSQFSYTQPGQAIEGLQALRIYFGQLAQIPTSRKRDVVRGVTYCLSRKKKEVDKDYFANKIPRMRPLQKWTCCGEHVMGPPCKQEEEHKPEQRTLKEISNLWQYTATPSSTTKDTRKAVVIDCEMGTAASGDCELIRLTLIDYFSSHVLIDKLVWPDVPMSHLNTKWSGVTWKMMHEARNKRKCVFGWRNARSLIWKFVSPETIVIGHGVKSDLTSLRWIHPRVIDTLIVEGDNHGATTGLSLKKLAEERLGRVIQKGRGHDSLEDATATRDLLHWNVVRMVKGTEA